MKKNFSVILFLVFGLLSFSSSFAEMRATSGTTTYVIPFLSVTGGGHQDLRSGDYHMVDLKGQGVIGAASAGSYSVGLGGIYGSSTGTIGATATGTSPGGAGALDNGVIFNTVITTTTESPNSFLRLTWEYRTGSGVTQADIYAASGTGQPFNGIDPGYWIKVNTAPISGAQYDADGSVPSPIPFPAALSDNINIYYRVVPAGTTPDQIFGSMSVGGVSIPRNNRTVGKIEVVVPSRSSLLVSLPIYCDSRILAYQGLSGVLFFPQAADGGLDALTARDATFQMAPGKGFWVRNENSTALSISFFGRFETIGTASLVANGTTLTGNPVPYMLDARDVEIGAGDLLCDYNEVGGFDVLTRNTLSGNLLRFTDGYWYKSAGNRRWNIDFLTSGNNKIVTP